MPRAGFEHKIPRNKQSQAHALDRAATGNSVINDVLEKIK